MHFALMAQSLLYKFTLNNIRSSTGKNIFDLDSIDGVCYLWTNL
jgi:hypothetical protein